MVKDWTRVKLVGPMSYEMISQSLAWAADVGARRCSTAISASGLVEIFKGEHNKYVFTLMCEAAAK